MCVHQNSVHLFVAVCRDYSMLVSVNMYVHTHCEATKNPTGALEPTGGLIGADGISGEIWVRLVFSNIKNIEFQFVFYRLCLV
jgi:hypothetical protein